MLFWHGGIRSKRAHETAFHCHIAIVCHSISDSVPGICSEIHFDIFQCKRMLTLDSCHTQIE
jgi:hypothetical protein